MQHGGHEAGGVIRDPGPFKTPAGMKTLLLISAALGAAVFLLGLKSDPTRAWSSFVWNHFYFMCFGIGGLFLASIEWLTSAMWSTPVRRLAESFTAYLPFALLTFIVLIFGTHDLYHWSHNEAVQQDPILIGKSGYLNMNFFIVRNVLAIVIWFLFAKKLIGNSLKQDRDGNYAHTEQNKKLAPIFLILFAITFTLTSFDLLMSLDPHWFSTIFGVYCFAGLFYSTLALVCLVTIYMVKKGYLSHVVNDNHMHDLGKFMFAFTVFWAYIGFSQFMLIWYANLPEETGYYLHRFHGNWIYVSAFLLVGKFATPFFLLMRRSNKRSTCRLTAIGLFMLFAQWIDVMWMVQPEFFKEGPKIGWIELGVPLLFLGVFGLLVTRFLSRHGVLAFRDPRLAESVHHHHQ